MTHHALLKTSLNSSGRNTYRWRSSRQGMNHRGVSAAAAGLTARERLAMRLREEARRGFGASGDPPARTIAPETTELSA